MRRTQQCLVAETAGHSFVWTVNIAYGIKKNQFCIPITKKKRKPKYNDNINYVLIHIYTVDSSSPYNTRKIINIVYKSIAFRDLQGSGHHNGCWYGE